MHFPIVRVAIKNNGKTLEHFQMREIPFIKWIKLNTNQYCWKLVSPLIPYSTQESAHALDEIKFTNTMTAEHLEIELIFENGSHIKTVYKDDGTTFRSPPN